MADATKIEWTESTWNPIVGCTAVSPGCDHCYAAREASGRLSKTPTYAGLAVGGVFTGEVRLLPDRLDQPLRWRRPRRIFVNSMSDLFHDNVPDSFIARVFGVMAATPRHTYQVLTKRHGRMRSLLSTMRFTDLVENEVDMMAADWEPYEAPRLPLPNVWLGVSVEDQQWADIRIPALLDTPAAVRWISAEPLLGPIDLHAKDTRTISPQWLPAVAYGVNSPDRMAGDGSFVGDLYKTMYGPNIDWVVVGGESGRGARPMHPDWARSLRDQCTVAGVPFLFKQWGEWCHSDQMSEDTWSWLDSAINLGQEPHPEPHRVGKRNAGRLLDGRTWDEYPA